MSIEFAENRATNKCLRCDGPADHDKQVELRVTIPKTKSDVTIADDDVRLTVNGGICVSCYDYFLRLPWS